MWDQIVSFVVHYWVEVLLGGIVTAGGFFLKRYIRLEKENRKREHEAELETITKCIYDETQNLVAQMEDQYAQLDTRYKALDQRIDDEVKQKEQEMTVLVQSVVDESTTNDSKIYSQIDSIRAGLLSIQGHSFKQRCRELLKPDHEITLTEWESISEDYEAYKGLDGNHNGDTLFAAVKIKYESSLHNNE